MVKKGLLVVSFGTSYEDARKENIEPVEIALKKAFPEYEMRRAFGSQRIIKKLKQRDGISVSSIQEAIESFVDDNFEELLIQPTYMIQGYEYEELQDIAKQYQKKFSSMYMGKPLLYQQLDYEKLICGLDSGFQFEDDTTAFVFMGHGTSHYANECYPMLEDQLQKKGFKNVFIATVEGHPVLNELKQNLKQTKYQNIVLSPLLLVAGDHARNDMAGENKDSWKNILEQEGMKVSCVLKGLGSYEFIQQMFVSHAKEAQKQ